MVRKNEVKVEKKYKDAVSLYADSGLSIKDICEQIGVGFSAFSSYLSKHHRDLILRRHNLNHLANVKLRGKRGQSTASHYKYKDAIAACDSQEYIEYNISQIARIFDVDCSSLANQLRRHYSDIIPRREMARRRMGIIVNLQYGARKWSREEYTKAVEVLQTSDMTIEEVADVCDVSYTGLREHILAYYPQITTDRKFKRSNATGQKIRGKRNGNWTIHEPEQGVVEKYEESVELYRTTSLDMKEIACITSVNLDGLRYHLRTWYPELIVQRRGFEGVGLENTKRYKKSTAEKYADAIERLQSSDFPTAKVAAEFGLNPETFRMYLKEHYPKLAAERGMVKVSNGRTVSCRSIAKYSEALHLYETTTESLKSIAVRLGLTYNSVGGFIRRNYPEVVEKHNALLVSSEKSDRKTMEKVCTGTKVAADKYAAAIECLKTTSSTMKDVTDKFGLNISSFRKYLYKHVPEVLRERKNRKQHMKRIILYADRYMRSKDFCMVLILLLFGVSVAHSQENINNSIKDIATDTIIEKKRMSSIEIHFRLDKYYLDLQYMGNQESLNRFSHQIDSIGISNIDSVVIVSQSSPEGVYEHNLWLSDNRTKTMRKYITETHPEIAPILTVNPDGESWAQLRNYVENDTLMGDEIIRKVLAVIDSDVDIETKKLRMQQLPVYSYLLRTYYPRIRNSMFCILYHHIITSESEPVEIAVQPEPEPVAELVPVVKDTLKVDTIQVPESEWIPKLYLKTNAIGLALAMANVAIEVDFAKHWSFNLPIYYSAWDYFKSTVKFRTLAIQPEFRYWFAEENDGFFTGAHFGLAYYNFAFDGDYRYQDHNRETPSIGGGVSMGYRLPISKNNRWRVEFSLGAGVYSRHYDKFHNTPRTKDGLIIEDIKKTYWGIDQAAVSFSYSFDLKKKGGIR